ncbi:DNA-methyltransferase [Staphylococcus debuckii]|uniref:DNA-methyltransferase n=1 Tax=Staphylococcus debuckii TaxID=2044912 RepID=UPI001F0C93B2|nr:site-specific DNA-methyltransferase [Staphylococcus debuckii]
MSSNIYFEESCGKLILDNAFEALEKLEEDSVDLIFADPPYFLSSGGISNSGGRMVSVDKGDWDKSLTVEEKHMYNKKWIKLCKRVMKDNATIWISGTLHNIYSVGMALEEEGFKILNNITWQKTNPPPNLGCRNFTHSTETILWAKKDTKKAKHFFDYSRMKSINGDKQMKDVWTGNLTPQHEKVFGSHPTQKPLYLLERIIQASSQKCDVVLDPFLGSGTTAVACKKLERNYIGIDINQDYLEIAEKRLKNTSTQLSLF